MSDYRWVNGVNGPMALSILLLIGSGIGSKNSVAQQVNAPGQVEKSQKMVEQWLSIERQTSALESDWLIQKPMLEQRLLLLEAEKQQLQVLLNEKSTDSGQVEQKRSTLVQEQSELEASQHTLEPLLMQLQQQLAALRPLLAPPILKSWQQASAISVDAIDTSKQLQISLQQLTKLAGFDQRISVIHAPINNDDGETILVKQLFIGASFAWFVSQDGSYAGSGQVTDNGWNWTFDNNLPSDEISLAIAMFEKKTEANFVNLPIHLTPVEAK